MSILNSASNNNNILAHKKLKKNTERILEAKNLLKHLLLAHAVLQKFHRLFSPATFYFTFGVEEMKSFPIFVFVLIQLDEGEELCTQSRGEKTLLVDDDDFERQIISIVGMLDGDSKNGTSILCFYVRFVDFIGEEKFNA